MLSVGNLLLALTAAAASTVSAEHLRVVFSAGGFSAVGGTGNYNGFAIVNDNGDAIYDDNYPGDHAPCYNSGGGRTFTIEGDCWASPRVFHCLADFSGNPKNCEVRDVDGNVLGSADGDSDTSSSGISVGTDGACIVEFESEDTGDGCPVDDGNGPLHNTDG